MTDENTANHGWQPGEDPGAAPEKAAAAEAAAAEVTPAAGAQQVTAQAAEAPASGAQTAEPAEPQGAAQPEAQQQAAAQQPEPQPKVAVQSEPQVAAQQQVEINVTVGVQSDTPQQPPIDPARVVYEKGCCSAAWDDVRNTKGWFGKVCLMALIDIVPILNWVIQGFALRWSRQLSLGKVQGMPKKIFCKRAFANGAMQFLVSLVVGFVIWVCTLILGFLPLVGFLASIALSLFIRMIMNFCYVRMAIFDELGEGFSIAKGFDCLKRQFGKAFCIEFMPSFVIGIIIAVIVGIIVTLFVVVNGFAIYDQIMNIANQFSSWRAFQYSLEYDARTQWQVVSVVLKSFAVAVPWLLVGAFIVNIFMVLITLIKTRATGHFVARYCSDWTEEPKFNVVLQCEEPDTSESC